MDGPTVNNKKTNPVLLPTISFDLIKLHIDYSSWIMTPLLNEYTT